MITYLILEQQYQTNLSSKDKNKLLGHDAFPSQKLCFSFEYVASNAKIPKGFLSKRSHVTVDIFLEALLLFEG